MIGGRAGSPNCEADSHTSGRDQEERTTTDPITGKGTEDGSSVVEDVENTVDQGLGGSSGDSDTFENRVEVVGHQTVARPLREKGDADDDQHTSLVALADKEGLEAAALVGFLLELQGGLDLFAFVSSQGVRIVATAVVLDDDSPGFLLSSLVHEPSGRFEDQQDEGNLKGNQRMLERQYCRTYLDDTGQTLQDGRNSPRPVVVDSERAVCGPRGNDRTKVPRRVVERGQGSSMSRERKLGDQKRGGGASETETETDEASRADEHADVLSASLDTDTDEHDDGTAEDGPSSTEAITSVGSEGKSANTTDGLCRSQLVASTKKLKHIPEWR